MKNDSRKKDKGNSAYTGADLERYVGSVLEEVKDGFKVQKEHSDGINQKLKEIEKTLDSHSNQIANLTMDMMEVKRDIKEIKFDIRTNQDRNVDKKHFVDLELRMRKLETKR